ncbi:AMP-binding protein [Azospira inquinata]|uniref:Long-chain-fatty-acid--CoA ligase n=1 Tax=Azospira inquinata TaxID=2785627 RepID=A0A975SLY1_9RHOO|nr:AMP-binding protein [Azospira inquinata]QWT46150.1 AMP-binding protein [Azospira inquinata]QWT48521.1 AMP-binding protein [Azospira inquinata]
MDKIWLQSYPPGVPPEVDLHEFSSLGQLFERSCQRFRERTAYISMGVGLTYGELDRQARAFGAYLQQCLKLAPGARIALMMPNLLQYPICLFGALRAGYTVVNCNPLYTHRELEHQLGDGEVSAIVIVENFAHTLEQALPRLPTLKQVIVTGIGDRLGFPKGPVVNFVLRHGKKMVPPWTIPGARSLNGVLAEGRRHVLQGVKVTQEDVAFLQYTGGTTGVAKGAMLTHGNVIANLQQAHAWIAPFLHEGEEIIVTALPLYHIFALTANCLTFLKIGATNLLIANPRDIPGMVKELGKYRFTTITGVNTLFNALLNHPDFAQLDFSRLHVTLGGGMAVQKAVALRWKEVTGRPLIEAYGLTETSPAVTINPLNLTDYNGAIGLPISSTEVAIRDDRGFDQPSGVSGEICVRGPQVMKGYWRRPDETAGVFYPDGFLRTGDVGVMDDQGFVRIVDRKKDMILVSGFNVYPNEVEGVVAMLPGVLEVAAVGVPDDRTGEAVMLFIVPKGPGLTREAVLAHCRENLTAYKVPRRVEFRQELPRTNVGKILRRALKEEALAACHQTPAREGKQAAA